MVRGYHQYKEIWPDLFVGEELLCEREVGNPHDPLAVAVKKTIGGEQKIVGHVPRRISPLCSVFIRRGGNIKCVVSGPRRYSSDLSQGGLELPCKYLFSTRNFEESGRLRKLIIDSLSKTCYGENPVEDTVVEKVIEEKEASKRVSTEHKDNKPITGQEKNNKLVIETSKITELAAAQKSGESMQPTTTQATCANTDRSNALVIADEVVCSPPRKKKKDFDEEQIIMGEELTDVEINFAQQLLKQQFKHINGFCSTLLQEKALNLTKSSVANRIQIIHCKGRKHWVLATTINSKHDTVKVYDSSFHFLDKDSLHIVENCFTCENITPQVKLMQCRKQKGGKECGVFAIAFAVALAFGSNPGRQNFDQDAMRAHLVRCFKGKQFSLFPCQ